ncbi:hypothetical protein C8R48DRAFT_780054 [Suillus tomentosus]|nr:hypothetical protein C8R48DRAFT_780054 [Suillus tomentosus]
MSTSSLLTSWHLIVLLLRTSIPSARHLIVLLSAPHCPPPAHLAALLSAPLSSSCAPRCPPLGTLLPSSAPCCPPLGTLLPSSRHLAALLSAPCCPPLGTSLPSSAPCCPPPAHIVTLLSTLLPSSCTHRYPPQHLIALLSAPSRMHRADQVSSSTRGLGKHFVSPRKSRDKRKTQTFVNIPGADVKRRQLALRISSNADVTMDISNDDNEWVYESDHNTPEPHLPSSSQCDISIEPQRRNLPDKASRKLYGTWTETIPTLIGPLLTYLARTWYDILQIEMERKIEAAILQARYQIHASYKPLLPSREPSMPSHEPLTPSREPLTTSHEPLTTSREPLMPSRGHLTTSREPLMPSREPQASTLHKGHCASILVDRCPACFAGMATFITITGAQLVTALVSMNQHTFYQRCMLINIIPNEAIDQCESSYEAADGKKQKAAMDSFDDTGLMALICRHNIPLFFANIDTPGEQQKYAVALLEHLFSLLPTNTTVIALYDVSCVLSRSLSQYDILDTSITSQLHFPTTAMHAYGHEWGCQLVYNPPTCASDWYSAVIISKYIISSHRQAASIGAEMRADLGDWDILTTCGVSIEELRLLWAHQQRSQLSICAHAPARLKKELDTVLALQADMATSDQALQTTHTMLEKETASDDTMNALDGLEKGHQRLMEKVEALYASLNIHDRFPELQGVNLDFVRTLLMTRDLKINIRKCAIGSFFEWDKLDRAVGGAQQALGTKLHQQTRKAIAKRQPALMTAIRKFNSYCERLESLYDPSWRIPLPMALPTKLADLRNNQTLMEDVWITPSAGDIPRWLDDLDVRGGIHALLKHDRCQEEQQRLSIEAENLCCYFGDELCALELALSSDATRFSSHAKEAADLAKTLTRGATEANLSWINRPLTLEIDNEEDDIPDFEVGPSDVDAHQIAFVDFLEEDSVANEDIEDIAEVGKASVTICWVVPEVLQVDRVPVPRKDQSITVQQPGATRIWAS